MTLQEAVEWCKNHGAEVDFGTVTFLKTDSLWLHGPDLPSIVEKAIRIEQSRIDEHMRDCRVYMDNCWHLFD